MKNKKFAKPAINNAIIWAAMMIASSLLMSPQDSGQSMLLLILFIGGWYASSQLIPGSKQLRTAECALIRRLGARLK